MAWTNPYAPIQSGTYTGYNYGQGTATTPYMMQPTMQTAVPLQQPQQQTSLLTVFVDSENEVNDYPVAAGTTVQLISFKLNKFWLKSTATNGVPQPVRSFSFTEEIQNNQTEVKSVTREEFDALSKKLDKLLNELGGTGNV